MMETLLATKLYYPAVRPNLVARPRLTQQLAQTTSWPFTLVCAPAGYGKTTLVAAGLAQLAKEQAVAWLSLDEDDNDPVRFWVYVIAALRSVVPNAGERALALLQSPQPSPASVVLTFLINDIAARSEPLVLVLDDYHAINVQPIHDGLAFLLEHLPPRMHLVLTSRIDPPLPLSRMRVHGQLNEVRAADLRFTPEEAAGFLQEVMGLSLTTGEVMALEARTEGWIAGLQLAALSMQGADDLPGFISAFSGSHRHLVDYLTEEVFARQPQPVQHFLLQTAVLDRFCAPLCDAILEIGDRSPISALSEVEEPALSLVLSLRRKGSSLQSPISNLRSQILLHHLERTNLFLVPLDEQRQWFRYHHLFAELLRFRARQILGADTLKQIHRRAALWFEAAGHWTEAIQQALAAGDYGVAGRVVAHQAAPALVRGEVASLVEWLAALPAEQIGADARLKLAQAWVSLFNGPIDMVEHQLQEAMDLIQRAGSSQAALRGEALAIRATLAMVRNDMAQNIADSEQALALLPADYLPLRSLVAWHLAFAYRSRGEVEQSIQSYHQAIALSEQGGNVLINLSARRELAELMMGQGELHLAQALLARLVEEANAERLTHLYPVSAAYVNLGEIQYELNLLETAAS